MIVRRLQSENIFKYARLHLTFPEEGCILISGDNESGKSSIVEIICLALFGRTGSLGLEQVAKAVKWDATRGTVRLDYTGKDGEHYSVFRIFGRGEPPRARLSVFGEETPLAMGVDAVDRAILATTGMDFGSYVDTLYLTQKNPEGKNLAQTVRSLAGAETLLQVAEQLTVELTRSHQQVQAVDLQIEKIEKDLATLALESGRLEHLGRIQRDEKARQSDWVYEISQLATTSEALRVSAENVASAIAAIMRCDTVSSKDTWQNKNQLLHQSLTKLQDLAKSDPVRIPGDLADAPHRLLVELHGRLSGLARLLATATVQKSELGHWLDGLGKGSPGAEKARTQKAVRFFRHKSRVHFSVFWLFLLLAVFLGGPGIMFSVAPQEPTWQYLTSLLVGTVTIWDPAQVQFLLVAGAISVLLMLNGLNRYFKNRDSVDELTQHLSELDENASATLHAVDAFNQSFDQSISRQVEAMDAFLDGRLAEDITQWLRTGGQDLVQESRLSGYLQTWQSSLISFRDAVVVCQQGLEERAAALQNQREAVDQHLIQLEEEVRQEKTRIEKDHLLRSALATLAVEKANISRSVKIWQVAQSLLWGTCQEISVRFSYELRRFIGETAPLFTQGRYQHLQLDENLNVLAFSSSKNDFVNIAEISRGVQHQLLLALRIAMSLALIARSESRAQLIVLDEPFAHYDRNRFRQSLDALPKISATIKQIFVINQEFDKDLIAASAMHIGCALEDDVLELTIP